MADIPDIAAGFGIVECLRWHFDSETDPDINSALS